MNHSINSAMHFHKHSTDKVTVALLIVLVTGFGLLAETHASSNNQQTDLATELATDLAITITVEQASSPRNNTHETGKSI